jgi:GINS complex subunit 2
MTSTETTAPSFAHIKRHACSDFLAGDEMITIVPSFSYPKPLELISMTSVGPFTAGLQVQVPMWLATLLKQKSLCRVQSPSWMQVEVLKKILKYEQDQDQFSNDLPFRYQEISRSLLAVGDLEDDDAIRILLQDISTVRMDKIRKNLHTLSEQSLGTAEALPIIDVTGIGSLELAAIEPFCATAFSHHLLLSKKEKKVVAGGADREEAGEKASTAPKAVSRLRRFR